MADVVRIKGLKELQRDFKRLSKDLDKQMTGELKKAAEPVRAVAEQRALGGIRNMTPAWAGQRVGVSRARGSVFIAPSARRHGGSPRPNLGALLMLQMEAAVDQKQDEVVVALEHMVDRLGGHYGL